MTPYQFAVALKLRREIIGASTEQVADLLDIEERLLIKWEAEKSTPIPVAMEGALARLKSKQADMLKRHISKLKHDEQACDRRSRAQAMIAMQDRGDTLKSIGEIFSICPARVADIIKFERWKKEREDCCK